MSSRAFVAGGSAARLAAGSRSSCVAVAFAASEISVGKASVADMEAIGPFPKATLAEAPAPIKEAPGLILPVELGVFTFNADGTKIASMTWDGSLGDTSEANTMEVGMPVLYAAMGKTLG